MAAPAPAQDSLFSRCPVCRAGLVADPREPCGECIEAFGPMLRRGTGPSWRPRDSHPGRLSFRPGSREHPYFSFVIKLRFV